MLNKEVCKRCINQHHYLEWDNSDDKRWNDGIICCPPHELEENCYLWKRRTILEDPPDYCRYVLEHIVSDNVKSKKTDD